MRESKDVKKLILLGIFAIAMGFLEAVVVVYLRKLYYPGGFAFPLGAVPAKILSIELLREITTIIMLLCIALIAGKGSLQYVTFFIYTFGVWDIFYYIALKVLLNWPVSLFTWDILFLIPVPWVGPVLAPLLCSVVMILFACGIIYLQGKGYAVAMKLHEWCFLLFGFFLIFCTFIRDYSTMIIRGGFLHEFFNLATNERFQEVTSRYVPVSYNWIVFIIGELCILSALVMVIKRSGLIDKYKKVKKTKGK